MPVLSSSKSSCFVVCGAISMDPPRKIIFWALMKDKPALRDKWTLTRDGKFSFDDFDFYGNQMRLSPFVRQEIRKEFAISIGGQRLKHTGETFVVPHTVQIIHFVEVGMTKEEADMAVRAYKEPPSPSKWIDIRVFHKTTGKPFSGGEFPLDSGGRLELSEEDMRRLGVDYSAHRYMMLLKGRLCHLRTRTLIVYDAVAELPRLHIMEKGVNWKDLRSAIDAEREERCGTNKRLREGDETNVGGSDKRAKTAGDEATQ